MRNLFYREPYKLKSTEIKKGYCKIHETGNIEKQYTVTSKHGIVLVQEFRWETNSRIINVTTLSTIFNGLVYSAELEETNLSQMQSKWLSTHFLKTIKKLLHEKQ